jgi:GTPase involved in cell partitioning and DNA repair
MATQLQHLEEEMQLYDNQLLNSAHLIVANKMDTCVRMNQCSSDNDKSSVDPDVQQCGGENKSVFEDELQQLQSDTGLPVVPVSALMLWNIQHLKAYLFRLCE